MPYVVVAPNVAGKYLRRVMFPEYWLSGIALGTSVTTAVLLQLRIKVESTGLEHVETLHPKICRVLVDWLAPKRVPATVMTPFESAELYSIAPSGPRPAGEVMLVI